jgi:hypothetical protein
MVTPPPCLFLSSLTGFWKLFNFILFDSDLPLFLVGDYNCDMLSKSSNYFKKILNRLNFENVIFEATTFTTETVIIAISDLDPKYF